MEITIKLGDGEPVRRMNESVNTFIYREMDANMDGKWHFVEIPESRLTKTLNTIKSRCRRQGTPFEFKVDKSKYDNARAVIYYRKK